MIQKSIRQEIINSLSGQPPPFKIILFGSYAYGKPNRDSDIDLFVVLDKEGKSETYRALIQNKRSVSRRLRELKRKYSIDLLVYTKDEWEYLKKSGSSFLDKIEHDGIVIL